MSTIDPRPEEPSGDYDEDEVDRLLGSAMAGILAKLDAATDFDACLADIYRHAGRNRQEDRPT